MASASPAWPERASWSCSASATSRCCAPSCRSRSMRRRASSAASTMRTRELDQLAPRLGVRHGLSDELGERGQAHLRVRGGNGHAARTRRERTASPRRGRRRRSARRSAAGCRGRAAACRSRSVGTSAYGRRGSARPSGTRARSRSRASGRRARPRGTPRASGACQSETPTPTAPSKRKSVAAVAAKSGPAASVTTEKISSGVRCRATAVATRRRAACSSSRRSVWAGEPIVWVCVLVRGGTTAMFAHAGRRVRAAGPGAAQRSARWRSM